MSDPRTPAPFAGLPESQQGFAGLRDDQQPSNLPPPRSAQDLLLQIRARQQEETETFQHLADHAAVADQAVAAERRRLRQQIEALKRFDLSQQPQDPYITWTDDGAYLSREAVLKLLGPEA